MPITGTASFAATCATDPLQYVSQIAFDATSASSTTGTSLSWPHTCSGADRYLVVFVWYAVAPFSTITATYNGVSMSLVTGTSGTNQTNGQGRWFVLANPASGTNTIAVTVSSGSAFIQGMATSFTGCTGDIDNTNGGGTGASVNPPGQGLFGLITPFHLGCWQVAAFILEDTSQNRDTSKVVSPKNSTPTVIRQQIGGIVLCDSGQPIVPGPPASAIDSHGIYYPLDNSQIILTSQTPVNYQVATFTLLPKLLPATSPGCFGFASSPVRLGSLIGWQHLRNRFKVLQSWVASGTVFNPLTATSTVATSAKLASSGTVSAPSSGGSGHTASLAMGAVGFVTAPGAAAGLHVSLAVAASGSVAAPVGGVSGSGAFHVSNALAAAGVGISVPPPPTAKIRITTAPRRT